MSAAEHCFKRSPAEELREKFGWLVGQISLPALVLLDQPKLPKNLDRYRLLSILGRGPGLAGGQWSVLPPDEGAQMGYLLNTSSTTGEHVIGKPYIDGEFTLGLGFQRPGSSAGQMGLVAVGSAVAVEPGILRIVQLQGVWTQPEARKRDSGMWGGFRWNFALIRGLVDVAHDSWFSRVEIMGYEAHLRTGNAIPSEERKWRARYDQPADDLDFTYRPDDGIWEAELPLASSEAAIHAPVISAHTV